VRSVDACRAIGARVRWLYRLGAVSTTRPDIVARLARSGAEPKAAALVTLVAALRASASVACTGRERAVSSRGSSGSGRTSPVMVAGDERGGTRCCRGYLAAGRRRRRRYLALERARGRDEK